MYNKTGKINQKKGFLMKKQYIALGTLLLIAASSLHAVTKQDILNKLTIAQNSLVMINTAEMASTLPISLLDGVWTEAFSAAKAFVIDNSKNLVGMKDSDIINAMNGIEKTNMDLINTIKIIRGSSTIAGLQKQEQQLASIKKALQDATNKLSTINMTLSNKKNAKDVIMSIKKCSENIIDRMNRIVAQKIIWIQ